MQSFYIIVASGICLKTSIYIVLNTLNSVASYKFYSYQLNTTAEMHNDVWYMSRQGHRSDFFLR